MIVRPVDDRVQLITHLLQQIAQANRVLVTRFRGFLRTLQPTLDRIQIGQCKLSVDHIDVIERTHTARHVNDVVVLKTAHDVRDRICLTDVREKFVSKAFAFGGTGHEACDINELDGRRQDALRIHDHR